jgi:hypothetical protein
MQATAMHETKGRRSPLGVATMIALALTMVSANAVPAVATSTGAAKTESPKTDAPTTVWLCEPGAADNPCEDDLTTTVVEGDGSQAVEDAKPAKRPSIDCFYVYPTVSSEPGLNADLIVGPEEIAVAEQQASRFSQVCRVFAPLYRQVTITGLFEGGLDRGASRDLAYGDVLAAWREYLAKHNQGRGVVFIGHSQGTAMLTRLIAEEVDPKRARRAQVVLALLIGFVVTVPEHEKVGGSFQHLRACRADDEVGCVVAYSSFLETPPPDALFGRLRAPAQPGKPDLEVMCVNPAALGGGRGPLEPYFRTTPFPGTLGAVEAPQRAADTPWVEFPDLYTAACQRADGAHFLRVEDVGAADDERPIVRESLGPTWGLHLVDVNLALGNLVDLVRAQSRAYRAASR